MAPLSRPAAVLPVLSGRPAVRVALCLAVAASVLVGCTSDGHDPNSTDRAFLQRMIPHHERAISVARIGVARAHDARVRAFAERIVREQTPELQRMRREADGLHLDLAAGAETATHRITDAETSSLLATTGTAFDRRFLQLHVVSETGAAQMAEPEVREGADEDAVDLARDIASAPYTQIPELRSLLRTIGG